MTINPFTGHRQVPTPDGGGGHIVKPAGKSLLQMPGARLSIHCNEGERGLAALAEQDMREADARHREGRTRTDSSRPHRSAGRPGTREG